MLEVSHNNLKITHAHTLHTPHKQTHERTPESCKLTSGRKTTDIILYYILYFLIRYNT